MPEPMLASLLCAALLDGPEQVLSVVHRSRVAYQLGDADGEVRVCLAAPSAVRLPHSVVVVRLPSELREVVIGAGRLRWGSDEYRVARWWRPSRPDLPRLRPRMRGAPVDELIGSWRARLGRGDGLTPYEDDVTCGALVTLRVAADPRSADWSKEVQSTPLERYTTATSAALLRFAAGGWCIDVMSRYLARLARCEEATAEKAALRSVGASSGRGLLAGVTSACDVAPVEAVAA
jgi:Protein of unknown function (DUF2877)